MRLGRRHPNVFPRSKGVSTPSTVPRRLDLSRRRLPGSNGRSSTPNQATSSPSSLLLLLLLLLKLLLLLLSLSPTSSAYLPPSLPLLLSLRLPSALSAGTVPASRNPANTVPGLKGCVDAPRSSQRLSSQSSPT